ncbi:MAG: chorismate mutase [Micavibrio aeruginosavorus]|uniref:chorismate mutase n=1 Tax=Micavibrio aeruginosavorus TaxID=349221 RepID=A0A7T5R1B4_9BACT|nr:MAG: chorismate mutase [Micavibrio aeruginosavorus]
MSQSLEEIRHEIDTLDHQVHDLLMKRAELIVKVTEAKRRNNMHTVQPEREAMMIRRLLARHTGVLPREAIARIWRELVGAVSLVQTGLKAAVTVPAGGEGLMYWDMAKDYFSSVLPMQKSETAQSALAAVREGDVTFAVVPWPALEDEKPWWPLLMNEPEDNPMRIMARLPFGDRTRTHIVPDHQALVIAKIKFESSGDDRSFLALDLDHHISRARIIDRCKDMGLAARSLYSMAHKMGGNTLHLLEVDGYVAQNDRRLTDLLNNLEYPEGRCLCLGGYPTPPVYEDKVGKSALESAAPMVKKSA